VRAEPDIDGIAALDEHTVRVLLWNYHDDLVGVAPTAVRLLVKVPASLGAMARVSHLRIDEKHGNAPGTWLAQGAPASPSAEQIAELRQAAADTSLISDETIAVAADGSVSLDFELPRFAVSLISYEAP
jgi:xylan 1,4-beta-xylosidase